MFRKINLLVKTKNKIETNLDSWERFEGGQATVNGGRLYYYWHYYHCFYCWDPLAVRSACEISDMDEHGTRTVTKKQNNSLS